MEEAASSTAAEYSRYGSTVHKQVYIYGGLDTGPTILTRNFGMAWGLGGWLLTPFLQGAGAETIGRLRARVAAELTTTFASTYTREVSLAGMLEPRCVQRLRETGDRREVPRHPARGLGVSGGYRVWRTVSLRATPRSRLLASVKWIPSTPSVVITDPALKNWTLANEARAS